MLFIRHEFKQHEPAEYGLKLHVHGEALLVLQKFPHVPLQLLPALGNKPHALATLRHFFLLSIPFEKQQLDNTYELCNQTKFKLNLITHR